MICSNGINTASGLYKIFIQIFAVIAEFERDTLTERIVDNMMELAKDGRWLGGNTPMGFTVRRVTTGSGKGKSAYSYLESLPEEKRMVQRLYEIFRTTRSIQSTAKQINEEGFHTPSGAAFNASTTRLVLRNPIYCTPVCDSEQCRICAEIPKKGILQREACSDRKNTPATM